MSVVNYDPEEFALFAVETDFLEIGSERDDVEFHFAVKRLFSEIDAVHAKSLMTNFERPTHLAPFLSRFTRHGRQLS